MAREMDVDIETLSLLMLLVVVVEFASMVLREQRTALLKVRDPVWAERLGQVQRNEAQLLQTAFAGVRSALRLTVPTAWDARRAVGELADALDTLR